MILRALALAAAAAAPGTAALQYVIVESGSCEVPLTASACQDAALPLGQNWQGTPTLSVKNMPRGCYQKKGKLRFNGYGESGTNCGVHGIPCVCGLLMPPAPAPTPAPTLTLAPTPPPGPAPTPDPPVWVALHNAKRRLHVATPDVVWDAGLAAQAQAYADTCPLWHGTAASRDFAGENLAWFGSSAGNSVPIDYGRAIDNWYNEVADYLWPTNPDGLLTAGPAVGHFTQVVWKATTAVGCGARADCANMFAGFVNNAIVCHYAPAGNMNGQFHVQVGELIVN